VPVVELDREAVEVRDVAALGGVPLLQLLEREGDVGDGCVDLAGQKKALGTGRSSESFVPR
jgi:hypothetical protein